jgi:pentatricopeptide repeat protein
MAAEKLLRRMELSGHVDVVSYNTYLKVALSRGGVGARQEVLQEMLSRGIKPNAVTYNSMVRDAVSRSDLARAWELVDEMDQAGVRPDAFTCSIIMKGSKHAPSAADLDRVLSLIRRADVVPDEALTNCLLDSCVRLNDVRRLTQVLDHFKSTGVVPSPHAYATLIRAYGHARRADKAWGLWRDLASVGGPEAPNEEAFACMVDACLAGGDLAGALSVLREVRASASVPPGARHLLRSRAGLLAG